MPAEVNPYQPPVSGEPSKPPGPRAPRWVAAGLLMLMIPSTVVVGTIIFLVAFQSTAMMIGAHDSEYVAFGQFLVASAAALFAVVLVFRGFLRVLTILLGPPEVDSAAQTTSVQDASKDRNVFRG